MTAASRAASLSAVAALMLAAVWFLWPSGLGGGTTYVSTHGISMEPRFHTGDLGVLRAADSYAVGDVIAYRSATLDTIVMHRIVDGDEHGFVTKGDNNDWLDEDRPTEADVLGKLFTRVPHAGKVLTALGAPGVLPFGSAGVIAVLGFVRPPRRRRGRRRAPRARRPVFSMPIRARAREVSLVSGAVALLAVVGGGVLLAMPATQTDTRTLQVTQRGEFSYTGTAERGATYPTGVIATGDTVWTRLSRGLTVSFADTVSGPGLADLRGAVRLDVGVAAADGWSAVVTRGPSAQLQNGTATASVPVDVAAARELLDQHFTEIGMADGAAKLTVTPVAEATGTVQGHPVTVGSPAALSFTMDAGALRPSGDGDSRFAPSTQTPVQVQKTAPRTFVVLSLSVSIGLARLAAFGTLLVAIAVCAACAWIGRSDRKDPADQFVIRHADRILPVASFTPGPAVVDVADAESLHKVAERFDTLVLHQSGPDEDVFLVRDVEMTYRFVMPSEPGRQRGKPPVPAPAPRPTSEAAPAPVPVDVTGPLPIVVPIAAARSVPSSSGLWGHRFA
jgi:signal peptidase I